MQSHWTRSAPAAPAVAGAVVDAKQEDMQQLATGSSSMETSICKPLLSKVLQLSDAQMSTLTPHRSTPKKATAIPKSAPDRMTDCQARLSLFEPHDMASDSFQVPLTCSPTPRKKPSNLQDNMFSSSSLLFPPKSPARKSSWNSSISLLSSDASDDGETDSRNNHQPPNISSRQSQVMAETTTSRQRPTRIVLSFAQASILSSSTMDPSLLIAMSPLRRVVSAPVHTKKSHSKTKQEKHHHGLQDYDESTEEEDYLVHDRWNCSEFGTSTRRDVVKTDDTCHKDDDDDDDHGNDEELDDDDNDEDDGIGVNDDTLRRNSLGLTPPILSRTKTADMPRPPRRRRSVSSSDLCMYTSSVHSSSCGGSGLRHIDNSHVFHQFQPAAQRRQRSSSLDEPAHVPTRRGSIRTGGPEDTDIAADSSSFHMSTSLPSDLYGTISLQTTYSRSMPTLPRRLSSRDLAFECHFLQNENLEEDDKDCDHDVNLVSLNHDLKVAQSGPVNTAHQSLASSRSEKACSSFPDHAPCDAKRKSTSSKVTSKTAMESSEDSTSGWSDTWSPERVPNRFIDFHKAASLPSLLSPRDSTNLSPSKQQHKQQQQPHHHHHSIFPSAVRRLVLRSRSASPTYNTHPGLGRIIQAVAKAVRKEPTRPKSSVKDKYLPSTEFMEPSSMYMDEQRVYGNADDGSLALQKLDLMKRRSSSSSGSQRSMLRAKLFGRPSH